ncbi:hypothetical protein PR048_020359 [Dryococelus australis]|uniref:Uncharacterized protein n=1 Tax=Dryococelus australis TaxID=614101 RepID=A0ABQ9H640_9NEOP|nr:hypothetical protein PR048_020359 [Dryococelus australis]
MKQRRNEGGGGNGRSPTKPADKTSCIVRQDSHMRKSSDPAGGRPGGGERANRSATAAPAFPVNMEQRRNEGVGETGDPREDPPTNGIVRHDSHLRKSGDSAGD